MAESRQPTVVPVPVTPNQTFPGLRPTSVVADEVHIRSPGHRESPDCAVVQLLQPQHKQQCLAPFPTQLRFHRMPTSHTATSTLAATRGPEHSSRRCVRAGEGELDLVLGEKFAKLSTDKRTSLIGLDHVRFVLRHQTEFGTDVGDCRFESRGMALRC